MDVITIRTHFIIIILSLAALLSGCAASELSRGTASSVDQAYIDLTEADGQVDLANTYQNTNQKSKGLLIGGVTGGLVGAATSVGVVGGAVTGAILLGSLGAYIDAHATLVDRLTNRGVQVFVLGDQVMLVVHSSRVFVCGTPTILNSFYPTMCLIAELIGKYTNISVKVAAYSNDTNRALDCSLTQLQAENFARRLWRYCLNTRLLYAAGYGGCRLVTRNCPGSYSNDNYRIEITFEKLPV